MSFDYYSLGDAAVVLGIPKQTLRYYAETGVVRVKRTSAGDRIIAPKDIERAKAAIAARRSERAKVNDEMTRRRQAKIEFLKSRARSKK